MIHGPFTLHSERCSCRVVLDPDPAYGPASDPESQWVIAQIETLEAGRWRVVPLSDPEHEPLREEIIAQEYGNVNKAWSEYRRQLMRAEAREEV